ncbi:nitroreductase [Candidatus Tenderia electrophaga]|jgi:nitroreductase|uniref:Nitroreductase n=1 Tax=Candidatus Tenderia electrophaga TaxID=1748243 RepID=A0A0S2TCU1_9GAMM|nr:nitroreductase [Candidatus Tenderia electrophaga]
MEKPAQTSVPIHALIAARWSPRALDPDASLSAEQVTALLEAARWAPSCFGDEPWRYVVCHKADDPQAWASALACLAEKNQRWAGAAPLLLIANAASHFHKNDKPNRWGQYDTGAASENLCLQATALGLAAHQMGGFDQDKARQTFNIPEQYTPMAVIAVGKPAPAQALDEEFRQAETAPRRRRPLGEICFAGRWGEALT